MANQIVAYSSQDNVPHYFKISNSSGVEVVSNQAAVYTDGPDSYKYVGSAAGLAAGKYYFSLHRSSNDSLKATGEFEFNGTDIIELVDLYKILRADQITNISNGSGSVEIREAGTSNTLFTKSVITNSTCDIVASHTE